VAGRGSMAKAAAELGVSIPTVSEVIAGLEHGLGVRPSGLSSSPDFEGSRKRQADQSHPCAEA
jgi:hypothetical protein